MPTYKTSQEWLEQSALLIKSSPSTDDPRGPLLSHVPQIVTPPSRANPAAQTRVTTTYYVKPPKSRPAKPAATSGADSSASADADTPMTEAPAAKAPRGRLVLKTFDPTLGVTLRYRTHKAAEISRLILAVGRLSSVMAGLPEVREEEMTDAPATAAAAATTPAGTKGEEQTSAVEAKPTAQPQQASSRSQQQPQQQQSAQGSGGGGGGKKKKKGKK
ncbi:hypothetical protein SODALDRAFT_23458 [Sodiomyces alkalinus F11]|uniref:SRP9 domain-containing protein n=1 Tax=Sodiomyces alkalinus (strain CBS 110278 / VKM F-3762 / F11) TaxID=1314773 RepID=A0A3N2Q7P4_SODAK|nr:hypothetical protein SODALDRAFT_23458 [Sodiomyces alkalinus F11]ROT42780.1 hypothetical protein SODALDRAFT_23458 [Sodiomyces alkalinus F11]